MAPKDFVNIDWNSFYSHLIQMNNEHKDNDEINLKVVQRIPSTDSLEQNDYENLRFISGYQKWINTNNQIRVDKLIDNHHHHPIDYFISNDDEKKHSIKGKPFSTNMKFFNEEENSMDISLNHFDAQLQVNNEQFQQANRYGVFSSEFEKIDLFQNNQCSQTTEMDVDNGDHQIEKTNGYSPHRNNNESYRNNQQTNGSANNNDNQSNPNRNNNNSRRSNDDGSEENDDDDDDDDDDNDDNDDDDISDETIARRLGFLPLNTETINLITRLRHLTNKNSFDRRDFETLQSLIDQLIHQQHLENSSKNQLKQIIHYLKLYRPLQTKSRALIFLQERIPRRAVKYNVISSNHEKHSNVFNIWRERERRARLDSKDSLEDDGPNLGGQQLRDVIEINHPTPPILLSMTTSSPDIITTTTTSKVKQMAKDIDTRSVSSRSELNLRTGDRFSDHTYIPRSSSPTYPGLVSVALYDIKSTNNDSSYNENLTEDRLHNKRNLNPSNSLSPTGSEASHVQKIIDRLELFSSQVSSTKNEKKVLTKKSSHDDPSDASTTSVTSSPSAKRVSRTNSNETKLTNGINHHHEESFIFHQNNSHNEVPFQHNEKSNEIKFELNRKEMINGVKRTVSGTTIEEYVTTLHPESETSLSMVRDVRTRVYEDDTSLSRTDIENIPVKVDVETLYILEEKSDRNSLSPIVNIYIPDYGYNRSKEQQDFAMQTTISTSTIKPSQRPIGTQVNSIIEQNTVGAQTTDSLLRRSPKERQRLPTTPSSPSSSEDGKNRTTTSSTSTRYEIKRRHSTHRTSEDEDDGVAVVFIDDKSKKSDCDDNFQLKREKRHSSTDIHLPILPKQGLPFGQVASRIRIDQLRDINRHVVRRHVQEIDSNDEEYRSSEVYEVHTRGACKCLVISAEEKIQYGSETRFEKQLQRIERTYTDDELKQTELHVIVASSDGDYQLVKRDYGLNKLNDDEKENENIYDKSWQPSIAIHYYTKEGHRMRTEHARRLEYLPLVIRSEIEYELHHYGTAQLIILSVTNSERRQMNTSLKKELVDEIVSRSGGRLSSNSPELEQEITRQLNEPTNLLHLVDYSSRDDYNQTNSTDLRRVSRIDITTSLRLVQRYRTIIHRLCQLYRSHLRLTHQAEQQRHLILVAHDEYYLLDLTIQKSEISANITNIRQRQHDIFKREVNNVIQQPFDFVKYRRDAEQQQRIFEQRHQQRQIEQTQQIHKGPPPPGHPSEAEFYLGSERRALIEREIHSMRESIRPHEHAPPRYKYEPPRRSLSISYSGGQRYVRARIIHVKDFYDETQQREQKQQRQAKEQELFVRVDDFINESAANSVRRSYSTDYLQEDGPRSRIRYIRIPGETIKIEEKTTYEYKGVVYANLPYSLRYWNILSILDREARQGRPLGSSLPQIIVNDPYRTVIPPLTQQEIRQTAQQILSPQYNVKSYTDQTLRWFLSRDNRTEIESAKYLQTLDQYRIEKEKQSHIDIHTDGQKATSNKYYVTETLVRYEKMPDRLVPLTINNRVRSKEILQQRSPSIPRILHPPNLPSNHIQRSQSQPRPSYQTSQQRAQLPPMHSPLSRHQSVHELHAASAFSHPPSPSPSLHSLHTNHYHQNRRPVAFNNRFPVPSSSQQHSLLTEIIDSQTGQRIVTTSQEQLPTEVLGLLNKYNLQQF